jgi:hypothetical protein
LGVTDFYRLSFVKDIIVEPTALGKGLRKRRRLRRGYRIAHLPIDDFYAFCDEKSIEIPKKICDFFDFPVNKLGETSTICKNNVSASKFFHP